MRGRKESNTGVGAHATIVAMRYRLCLSSPWFDDLVAALNVVTGEVVVDARRSFSVFCAKIDGAVSEAMVVQLPVLVRIETFSPDCN